ncbi:MAG TPA: transglutaminase-like domain-containing protein [Burkholderiales bacterium]|nr:transglutaminase-like domain-containing protein [Burkholderiales bacterium]
MPVRNAHDRSDERTPSAEVLKFYAEPSALTSPGRYAAAFDALPDDPVALARVVQGLVLHKYMAHAYGVNVPRPREVESHTRRVESLLDQILAHDDRPLSALRAPEKRLFGVCGHFTVMLVAMLRAKGIPARERAGFGAYFNAPYFEEHVLCEYWNADDKRWVLLDTQFDETWHAQLKIDHDAFDVPRDRFLTAGLAWSRCRSGQADANRFGIFQGNKRGLWFVAAELIRDVAALNKMEVLVWDVWGAMPKPDARFDAAQLQYFDQLAALTRDPDASFDDLMALYRYDQGVQVPPVVFNVITNRPETV